MTLTAQLAKHFREVHAGGNWTSVNLNDTLAGISWQQANEKVYGLNTIAALAFHIHYYIRAIIPVIEGGPLHAKDALSFIHPPIQSQTEWESFLEMTRADAFRLASLIDQMPDEQLWEPFTTDKYGSYYRNIQGIIEHCHYHLGQIVVIKKILIELENKGLQA